MIRTLLLWTKEELEWSENGEKIKFRRAELSCAHWHTYVKLSHWGGKEREEDEDKRWTCRDKEVKMKGRTKKKNDRGRNKRDDGKEKGDIDLTHWLRIQVGVGVFLLPRGPWGWMRLQGLFGSFPDLCPILICSGMESINNIALLLYSVTFYSGQ